MLRLKIFAAASIFLLLLAPEKAAGQQDRPFPKETPEEFVDFRFNDQYQLLTERIRVLPEDCWGGFCQTNEQLDTLCNAFYVDKKRVKIIRQDDGWAPEAGLGLIFTFDPLDSLPQQPISARVQFNDFRFGGPKGSATDRSNYTGVTNSINSELKLTVEKWADGWIEGRFEAILVNGSGGMAPLEDGRFRVRLFEL